MAPAPAATQGKAAIKARGTSSPRSGCTSGAGSGCSSSTRFSDSQLKPAPLRLGGAARLLPSDLGIPVATAADDTDYVDIDGPSTFFASALASPLASFPSNSPSLGPPGGAGQLPTRTATAIRPLVSRFERLGRAAVETSTDKELVAPRCTRLPQQKQLGDTRRSPQDSLLDEPPRRTTATYLLGPLIEERAFAPQTDGACSISSAVSCALAAEALQTTTVSGESKPFADRRWSVAVSPPGFDAVKEWIGKGAGIESLPAMEASEFLEMSGLGIAAS